MKINFSMICMINKGKTCTRLGKFNYAVVKGISPGEKPFKLADYFVEKLWKKDLKR